MSEKKQEIKEYGSWIKHKREELGITQQELANRAGVSLGTIGPIESGSAKAVGEKTKNKLEHVLNGGTLMYNHNNGTQGDIHQIVTMSFNHLEEIAKEVLKPDFLKKVETISSTLSIERSAAAIIIFEQALKK